MHQAIARSLNPKAVPAAEDWLRSVGKSEKKVIQRALQAADKSYIDSALKRTLQPDAQKAVEKWMEKANPKGNCSTVSVATHMLNLCPCS